MAFRALFLFSNQAKAKPLDLPLEGFKGILISETVPNLDNKFLKCFS